jgi:hypothetical protein
LAGNRLGIGLSVGRINAVGDFLRVRRSRLKITLPCTNGNFQLGSYFIAGISPIFDIGINRVP